MIAINGLTAKHEEVLLLTPELKHQNQSAELYIDGKYLIMLCPTDISDIQIVEYGYRYKYWIIDGKIYSSYFTNSMS